MLKKLQEKFPRIGLVSVDFFSPYSDHTNSSLEVNNLKQGWNPENRSVRAYSLADIQDVVAKNALKIWPRFRKDTPGGFAEVRTVKFFPSPKNFVLQEMHKLHPGTEALGQVAPKRIFLTIAAIRCFAARTPGCL